MQIARGIPAPFQICPLVAQTLFSQMLALPNTDLDPLIYSTIIIHLCKVNYIFMKDI